MSAGTLELMSAHIAESDVYDVLVDNQGALWIRSGFTDEYVWKYVTDEDGKPEVGWDTFDRLPVNYGPYIGVDAAAAAVILKGLK